MPAVVFFGNPYTAAVTLLLDPLISISVERTLPELVNFMKSVYTFVAIALPTAFINTFAFAPDLFATISATVFVTAPFTNP